MKKNNSIIIKDSSISTSLVDSELFISLTDMARNKNPQEPKDVVKNWMRSRTTIEYLGIWEQLNNSDFKGVEFDSLLYEAGNNSFTLSPTKWVELTDAVGIISKRGKNGGTYAHQDIALEFASWISAEFKIYLLKEFKRLKTEEFEVKHLEWNLTRTLSKVNYHIHTDAIKENLIPENIKKDSFIYANEADLLNLALFGQTAKQWREENPNKKGNVRDYATMEQLVVLSNMESMNAELIKGGVTPSDRFETLNNMAISQMKILIQSSLAKRLK
jgi:hypothetical protein